MCKFEEREREGGGGRRGQEVFRCCALILLGLFAPYQISDRDADDPMALAAVALDNPGGVASIFQYRSSAMAPWRDFPMVRLHKQYNYCPFKP